MRVLRFLLRKEYLQIFRDKFMVAQMLLLPCIQLAILANAATFEVKNARLAVVDEDHTSSSRGLVQRLVASGRFVLVSRPVSWNGADQAMLRREAGAILRIPTDFERDLVRTRAARVQLVLNAEDGAAAGVTLGYAQRIIADYAAELATTLPGASVSMSVPQAARPTLDVRTRGWYNPELDYKYYM